jgi:hypothetical protein
MRKLPVFAALTLGLTLALAPSVASAYGPDDDAAPEVELTASYLYQKVNPEQPASWWNSGRQTRFSLRDGHAWLTEIDLADLPVEVCGPGWAIQEDMTVGLEREEVPSIVDRATSEGLLGWPPIVKARHVDLEQLADVPDCGPEPTAEPTAEPTTQPTTEVGSGGGTAATPAAPATAVLGRPSFTG